MKLLLIATGILLVVGAADLPAGYYTFLRIVVTITSGVLVFTEIKSGFNFWVIVFCLTAILFNPVIPVHFNDKTIWAVTDFICGVIFIVKASLPQKHLEL